MAATPRPSPRRHRVKQVKSMAETEQELRRMHPGRRFTLVAKEHGKEVERREIGAPGEVYGSFGFGERRPKPKKQPNKR